MIGYYTRVPAVRSKPLFSDGIDEQLDYSTQTPRI